MSSLNLNKVILVGRMTADPELKQTQSGISVTSFSIAVNRRFTKAGEQAQADFLNIVAWRQQAEFVARYFHKGSAICIVGSLQSRSWTDQNNQKRYATEVIADEISFVDSKSDNNGAAPGTFNQYPPSENYSAPAFASNEEASSKFEELSNDDDLPF